MRRLMLSLMLVCGIGMSLAAVGTASAEDAAVGPVAFTVHLAACPISDVNSDLGFYDACHDNGLEGQTLTFSGLDSDPVSFTTDAAGIGTGMILDGASSVDQVVLAADASLNGDVWSYAYCSDQVNGDVLFNGSVPPGGAIPLFTVNASQTIVCDWFIYSEG